MTLQYYNTACLSKTSGGSTWTLTNEHHSPLIIYDTLQIGQAASIMLGDTVLKVAQTYMSKKNKRTHVPLSKELEQTQGIKIGCLNIIGLLSKLDELKLILEECHFDIIGVCETFIDSNVGIMKLVLTGTALLRKIETYTVEECYCTLEMVSIIRNSLN